MKKQKLLQIFSPGLMKYKIAWDKQKYFHAERVKNMIPDTLMLLEHPNVYTLGRHGNDSNIIGNKDFLKKHKIEIYNIERGGDVTFHGPGQIVGYPIFNIRQMGIRPKELVEKIENIIIELLSDYNIEAKIINKLPGVWVGDEKIAAIGMRIIDHVALHGFALNVNTNLKLFNGIVPCGIQDKGVTSIKKISGKEQNIELMKTQIIKLFKKWFGFDDV
ncbi:MAG: lipoyl(octanoyl) transferase LipB, partial [Candidatus Marinimicrobia bacterium]|nr:lipoyl(octanoyl) transferase LipB [Candidatus Neomarinimicrobiota bacterium]